MPDVYDALRTNSEQDILGTILCLSANNMPLCWKVIVLSSHNTAELIREL